MFTVHKIIWMPPSARRVTVIVCQRINRDQSSNYENRKIRKLDSVGRGIKKIRQLYCKPFSGDKRLVYHSKYILILNKKTSHSSDAKFREGRVLESRAERMKIRERENRIRKWFYLARFAASRVTLTIKIRFPVLDCMSFRNALSRGVTVYRVRRTLIYEISKHPTIK